MPEALREALGRGFLGVRVCGNEEYVTSELLDLLSSCPQVAAVGDFVCLELVRRGYVPRVCVVDGVTRRALTQPIESKYFSRSVQCVNPRSHICQNAVEKIRSAVQSSESRESTLILVDGEEDLLALPTIAEAPPGWCVIYGLPGCGVELVVVDKDTAESARRIIGLFEEVEL